MAAAVQPQVQRPRVVYVKPSMLVPGGTPAPAAKPAAPTAPAAPTQPAATTPAQPTAPSAPAQQAKAGPGLLQRALGAIPLAAGLTQALVGFMITNGTISLAAVPLLGTVPGWIVGTLVGATAVTSIMQGVRAVLGS